MKDYERLKMMEYPKDRIDLVIDTDAATEIDDQFAIAYALLSRERFHIRGIYAAPFAMNEKTKDPNVGMQMSYDEIVNIMHLCGENPDGSLILLQLFYNTLILSIELCWYGLQEMILTTVLMYITFTRM